MQLARIDFIQCTPSIADVPIEDRRGMKARRILQIRHVWIANVRRGIDRAKRILPIVSIQNRYNIIPRPRFGGRASVIAERKDGFLPWLHWRSGRSFFNQGREPLEAEAKRLTSAPCNWLSPGWLQKSRSFGNPDIVASASRENMAAAKLQLTRTIGRRMPRKTLRVTRYLPHAHDRRAYDLRPTLNSEIQTPMRKVDSAIRFAAFDFDVFCCGDGEPTDSSANQ